MATIPGLVGIFAPGMGNTLAQAATQPPLLPVNSPANLQSSNPAVQTAAQVMNDEQQAKQKIAAINYLGTIGCGGCYPDIEDALLASLDDCTESVRFAAVNALHESTGHPCRFCNSKACCSAKVRERLNEIAYASKDATCYQEPSPRVRRMARLALLNCGSECLEPPLAVPAEGPSLDPGAAPVVAPVPAVPPALSLRSRGRRQTATSSSTTWIAPASHASSETGPAESMSVVRDLPGEFEDLPRTIPAVHQVNQPGPQFLWQSSRKTASRSSGLEEFESPVTGLSAVRRDDESQVVSGSNDVPGEVGR